ncbi:MAG: DUF3516 domain-containing protein [Myxococcota bacterium]
MTTTALSSSTSWPLARLLPEGTAKLDQDEVLNRFLAFVAERGLSLYPAQEEALLEIVAGKNIIMNTPTGSGKSLVAEAMIFKTVCDGKRAVYTCPIKALVNEKFFALCNDFGPERVGMMTGDAAINRDAPIICCTAEVLSNWALRQGEYTPAQAVIMDEFHYYTDRERGVAWQVPLLTMPQSTFLLMSATLGDTTRFEEGLTRLNGKPTAVIRSMQRPVPLEFEYRETPLHETIEELIGERKYPIYVVNFTQRACAEEAQNLMSVNFCTREEKQAINEALADFHFDTPYGKEIQKFLRHGLGLHHAGLLPKYRLLTEKLSQQGLLKIVCGTDTLGVGVNIPIRCVLFTKLCKYDGEKTGILSVREFMQISGRAGRKGFDDEGFVVVQAPEHVIENIRIDMKKASDPQKYKKLQKAKPPEKGFVHWDRQTFEKLTTRPPEELQSRFNVSHGMLIHLLQSDNGSRQGGYGRMVELISASHSDERTKRAHRRTGRLLFRSLLHAELIKLVRRPSGRGQLVEVSSSLQRDFSLNTTLSLFLVETLAALDPESETYALDVLTVVESTLEDPDTILFRQLDKLKKEKLAQLKAEGVEYEQRIEELEKLEHPKPLRDFIYGTFNAFADKHPWLGQNNIKPKSVAREMYERFCTFHEYIREYELQRSEGLLLRYLSDTYKTLLQTVPDSYKTQEVYEITEYFRTMIRSVDSSLVDEWEGMQGGVGKREGPPPSPTRQPDLAENPKAFTARVRSEMHLLLKALADKDYAAALGLMCPDQDDAWTVERLESSLKDYYATYPSIMVHHGARTAAHTLIKVLEPRRWSVVQTLVDPEGDNQWMLDAEVDLRARKDVEGPLITLRRIGV